MTKRNRLTRQTTIYKTLHRKHRATRTKLKTGVNSGVCDGLAVSFSLPTDPIFICILYSEIILIQYRLCKEIEMIGVKSVKVN